MKKKDLKELIDTGDIEGLADIVNELCEIKHKTVDDEKPLSPYDEFIIKSYNKESIEYYKKIFLDNSTCDVSDGLEKTVPYQVGLIKAYCYMILNK